MSEGRTRPAKAAMNNTIMGVRACAQANSMKVAANAAYRARERTNMRR